MSLNTKKTHLSIHRIPKISHAAISLLLADFHRVFFDGDSYVNAVSCDVSS